MSLTGRSVSPGSLNSDKLIRQHLCSYHRVLHFLLEAAALDLDLLVVTPNATLSMLMGRRFLRLRSLIGGSNGVSFAL